MGKIIIKADPDIADLIPEYLKSRELEIGQFREKLDSGDIDSIRISGHSLKGSGGGYGFPELTRIGAEIEKAALAKDKEKIKGLVDELETYLGNVEVVY